MLDEDGLHLRVDRALRNKSGQKYERCVMIFELQIYYICIFQVKAQSSTPLKLSFDINLRAPRHRIHWVS